MMKLYYIPTTRAMRPRWLLEELGLDYELIYVDMAMTEQADYRRQLHPLGKVPVWVDDRVTLYESSAICTYLADRYLEKGFAPTFDSPSRGHYYQWLFYAGQTLETPVEQYMFHILPNLPEKMLPKAARTHVDLQAALEWFERACQPLNDWLRDREYLIDNRMSAADVVLGGVLVWALKLGMMERDSSVKTYLLRLMKRPAYQRADEDAYAEVAPPKS